MPRPAKIWERKGRGFYVKIGGKQVSLGKDRAEAERRFHLLRAEWLASKRLLDTSRGIPVRLALAKFLASFGFDDGGTGNGAHSVTTWGYYVFGCRSFGQSIEPSLLVADLKPYHVSEWAAKHTEWSVSTRRARMRAVKRALAWALDEGLIDRNPIGAMRLPQAERAEGLVPTEQFQRMLGVASAAFGEFLAFHRKTGCRPNEAMTLRAEHFNADRSIAEFAAGESKGGKRVRRIIVPEALRPMIRRRCKEYPTGPIFRGPKGGAWNAQTVYRAMQRIRKALGEPVAPLKSHRHFVASNSIGKVSVAELARNLGHNPETLMRNYQHWESAEAQSALASAAERMAEE